MIICLLISYNMRALKYKRASENHLRAFTLIEMLVVISVVSLLMAITLPAMSKVKRNARRIQCAAQMQQISLAIQAYAEGHDQKIITTGEMMYAHTTDEAKSMWFVRLLPYVGESADEKDILKNTTDLWICPEDKDAYPRGFLNCPHNPMTSYAPNGYYPQRNAPQVPPELRLGPAGGYTLAEIRHPSDCFIFGETSYAAQFYDADAPSVAKYNLPRDGHYRSTSGFYHNGTMNLLYVDGHVGNIKGRRTDELVWPVGFEQPHRTGQYMYWPDLTLPSAVEEPAFWGPGY